MIEDKYETAANKYLGAEIKKRWGLLYDKRYNGAWLTKLPNGYVGTLNISYYGSSRVFRFRDCNWQNYRILKRVDAPYFSANKSPQTEVSFAPDELQEIVPWILDNYVELKSVHPSINDESKYNCALGEPLKYLWTKKGIELLKKDKNN